MSDDLYDRVFDRRHPSTAGSMGPVPPSWLYGPDDPPDWTDDYDGFDDEENA